MKTSRYNTIMKYNDATLAFNAASGALAEVDDDFINILTNIKDIDKDSLSSKNKELYDGMIDSNFIIEDDVDELQVLEYRYNKAKYENPYIRALTIAPTVDCNFACPYCYESSKKGIMSLEIQDAIVAAIEKSIKYNDTFSLTWYGGEPLVAKDVVLSLSKRIFDICEKNNIRFSSNMITNGYLLNEELIKKLVSMKVQTYQITIDGPPEIHNKRRRLRGELQDTFYKIIGNIKLLLKYNANVNIRINVDKENVGYIDTLLDILKENNLQDCRVYFGHVQILGEACSSISSCFQDEEFANFDFKYNFILSQKGFNKGREMYYPTIKENYCGADSSAGWVVDLDGYLYNCWNAVGCIEKAAGNIKKLEHIPDNMVTNNAKYMLWSPFKFDKCKECNVLPLCMGGCPDKGLINSEPICDKWKYNLSDVIVQQYLNSIEQEEAQE